MNVLKPSETASNLHIEPNFEIHVEPNVDVTVETSVKYVSKSFSEVNPRSERTLGKSSFVNDFVDDVVDDNVYDSLTLSLPLLLKPLLSTQMKSHIFHLRLILDQMLDHHMSKKIVLLNLILKL